MNIQELTTKIFLTDVEPADIHPVDNGAKNLVYVIDKKVKLTNATWWHIVYALLECGKTLAIRCTLVHGDLSYFISHRGMSNRETDKELDCVHIRIHNINSDESKWVIKYY